MTLPSSRPATSWVDSGAAVSRGQDLLGLRLPVQTIGNSLLNGITTITPSVRYLTFRAWIAHLYMQARLPNQWDSFREFASHVEAAIALGNILINHDAVGVLGSDEAKEIIASGSDPILLQALVKQLGVNTYAGPSEQVHLTFPSDSGIPGLSEQRGLPLATELDNYLSHSTLRIEFSKGKMLAEAESRLLEELGPLVSVANIPDIERELLVAAILPALPRPDEWPRLATFTALLFLAARLQRPPNEKDLFNAALLHDEALPAELHDILDGWVRYCVRDLIAITHEAVLREVIRVLEVLQPDYGATIPGNEVIRDLVQRVDDHRAVFRELGLIYSGESPLDLSFNEVFDAIKRGTATEINEDNGLRRWSTSLNELTVSNLALKLGAGVVALLPIAWILAFNRVEPGVVSGETSFDLLSSKGWGRIGLSQIVIPSIRKFRQENPPYSQVMADLTRRTVDQHLSISWSRMGADARKDVAVLTSDGDRWSYRKVFNAGRTGSRIREAVGWLTQLGLVNKAGLTVYGETILDQSLKALRTRGAE
jgi:hypothetical protein